MASNYLVSVPKLKGRENYSEWCFAAENYLVLEGTLNSIKCEESKPAVSAEIDAKTRAKLILTIDPSIYVHIKEVASTKELWDKLKSLYDDSGFTRKICLLRNLISIRLESCTSMNSYVTQLVETGQKLAGTGFNINDEWIGSLLLAGLTENFSPMIMAIEHSGMKITTDAIKSKLLDMESKVGGNDSAAFGIFKHKKRWSQHKKNDKPIDNGVKYGGQLSAQTSNMSVSNAKKIQCFKCKQMGHYRNQCMNTRNSTEMERKQTNAFSAVFLSGIYSKSDWYIDSGASVHLTTNEDWIKNASYNQCTKEIIVANNNKVPVKCSGNVQITTCTDNCNFDVTVEEVMCVPSLTTNLLSVSQLIKKGNRVIFRDCACEIYNKTGVLVAIAKLVNGVYKLNTPVHLSAAAVVSNEVWHRRLGHVNSTYLSKMQNAVEGVSIDQKVDISKSSCVICCEGKQSRLPFPSSDSRSSNLLDIVHTDVCGPMECTSLGGSRYFILFVDDYSRMTHIYFMKNKSEAFQCFKDYTAKVENLLDRKIKVLRSDNGCEFCSSEFENFLKQKGIIHQKSNPYTPQQNGLSERMNRTIVEKARCLLFDAGLNKLFWAEATNTAVYLQNRTVSAALNNKTPFELWTNTKPNISHLRVFGSTVMKHVPKEKRQKWDKKSEECILVGYSEDVKGYRIYNPKNKLITTSRDVIIIEKDTQLSNVTVHENNSETQSKNEEKSLDSVGDDSCQSDDPFMSVDINETTENEQKCSDSVEDDSCESDDSFMSSNTNDTTYVPSENEVSHTGTSSAVKHKRERRKPEWYGISNMCTESNNIELGELSLEEALESPEKEHWLRAVQEELQCFDNNNAWELADVPKGGPVVKCKWVLKKKLDSENNICYRARLVAKGYSQKSGIDYNETFSPVVRHTTLRLLFALAVQLDLNTAHLDVKTAFLNGELDETIYMQKPDGFKCSNDDKFKVLKLKKAIYGLKQSSRAWHKKVDSTMLAIGYKKSKLEPCLYTKFVNGSRTIVTLYVDDFFIFSNDKQEMKSLRETLSTQFKIKDLGQIKQCLGITVNTDKENNVITLSQEKYIDQLLCKFNMSECKTVDTPMEVNLNCVKNQDVKGHNPYQQLIGGLMYLAVLTRPDIAYAVGFLSQFNNCHNNEQWLYAKRILKYLKRTKNLGLKYCKNGNINIEGYCDADWANDITDRKSYSGFCFVLSGAVISWGCKKQRTVALSSTEAEYMAITEACREAVYLLNLQNEITREMYTINIYNDNQSAQKLSKNALFHNRTKHIDVRYHYCREVISNNIVKINYMPTNDMPADILTKSLNSIKHHKFVKMLGVVNVIV